MRPLAEPHAEADRQLLRKPCAQDDDIAAVRGSLLGDPVGDAVRDPRERLPGKPLPGAAARFQPPLCDRNGTGSGWKHGLDQAGWRVQRHRCRRSEVETDVPDRANYDPDQQHQQPRLRSAAGAARHGAHVIAAGSSGLTARVRGVGCVRSDQRLDGHAQLAGQRRDGVPRRRLVQRRELPAAQEIMCCVGQPKFVPLGSRRIAWPLPDIQCEAAAPRRRTGAECHGNGPRRPGEQRIVGDLIIVVVHRPEGVDELVSSGIPLRRADRVRPDLRARSPAIELLSSSGSHIMPLVVTARTRQLGG